MYNKSCNKNIDDLTDGGTGMKQIICFGDSNTYGYIPETGKRYPWGIRWTSILSEKLGNDDFRVVEEGLCGRTTVFEDPLRDGRCGVRSFPTILETHAPSEEDVVVIMLGTNDCKTAYGASPELIALGAGKLLGQIRAFSEKTKIILVSPIHLGKKVWQSGFDPEFSEKSVDVSLRLSEEYRKLSERADVFFLDASEYAQPSEADQEHMNEEGHRNFAEAVYRKIIEIAA